MNSIALGFRSNDRAGPPPFGRQAGVPTPALNSDNNPRLGVRHSTQKPRDDATSATSPLLPLFTHFFSPRHCSGGRHRTAHTVPPARDHALSWSGRSPRSLSESSHSLRPMPRPASTVLRRSCLACKSGSKRLKHTCTKAKGTPALNPAPPLPFNHKYIYTPSNRSRVGTSWQTCLLCETVNEPDGLADRQFLDCPLTSLPCSAYNCTRVERACT